MPEFGKSPRGTAAVFYFLVLFLVAGCGRDWKLGTWVPEDMGETTPGNVIGETLLTRPWDAAASGIYLYVTDNSNNSLFKFDPSKAGAAGEQVWKIGTSGTGNLQFNGPEGVAVGSSGSVYVADRHNARIQHISSAGTFLRKWGAPQTADNLGELVEPVGVGTNINTDGFGSVFVSDASRSKIVKFSALGVFQLEWGELGTGDGQLDTPAGVAVDKARGLVYVVDAGNQRVQVFNLLGQFQRKFGTNGTANGEFRDPWGIAVESDGKVDVSDRNLHRVQRFDADGNFLSADDGIADTLGAFVTPTGLAASGSHLYICETDAGRVRKASWIDNLLQ
jgi:DNA-binding beta-propeller fold protein YncE